LTPCPHLRRGRPDGLDDVLIAGAAAQVGRKHVQELLVADIRPLLQDIGGEHQESGRAEAALQPMMVHERLLQRVQIVAVRQTLDRADFPTVRLHGEHQAGAHRLVVDDDCAGAANAVLAADMGAGLPAVIADRIDQRPARFDPDRVIDPVDIERDLELLGQRAHGRKILHRCILVIICFPSFNRRHELIDV